MSNNPLRRLPAVNQILDAGPLAQKGDHPRDQVVALIREELATLRETLRQHPEREVPDAPTLAQRVWVRLESELRPRLRPVINATGIVLHTNLGRAPLAGSAVEAVTQAAHGYLNLELDLETGKRSSRQSPIRAWLTRLTGAESATVVNNNAAATVIVLRALCQGKEVVVSRGQLVEIGGSFRIPEIMAVSGAILREVGTTNITRLSDYEKALTPATGAVMQIHTSNYRIAGFTRMVPLADLIHLGRRHQLPVIDDVGSGALVDFEQFGLKGEPTVKESVRLGADLVLFSGDKLLGGPQAGIIVGRTKWIQKIEKDPLMRAFRLDKLTLSALEATLRLYLDEERALRTIPTLRMLGLTLGELRVRGEALLERIRPFPGLKEVRLASDVAYVGGGSLPDQTMPTMVLEVNATTWSAGELSQRLRTGTPAVMGRVRAGAVVLDLRTVFPDQDPLLVQALQAALAAA